MATQRDEAVGIVVVSALMLLSFGTAYLLGIFSWVGRYVSASATSIGWGNS